MAIHSSRSPSIRQDLTAIDAGPRFPGIGRPATAHYNSPVCAMTANPAQRNLMTFPHCLALEPFVSLTGGLESNLPPAQMRPPKRAITVAIRTRRGTLVVGRNWPEMAGSGRKIDFFARQKSRGSHAWRPAQLSYLSTPFTREKSEYGRIWPLLAAFGRKFKFFIATLRRSCLAAGPRTTLAPSTTIECGNPPA